MSGAGATSPADADADADVVYEVNVDLDATIRDAYLAWLGPHMRELCALPGFIEARSFEVDPPPPGVGRVSLCMQYTLRDAGALDAYLRDHAPRLRAEGEARFGGLVRATRRILRPLDRA